MVQGGRRRVGVAIGKQTDGVIQAFCLLVDNGKVTSTVQATQEEEERRGEGGVGEWEDSSGSWKAKMR